MFPTRFFAARQFAPRYFPRPSAVTPPVAQEGGMMYARRLPDAYDTDEDALILLLMGALLDE